MKSDKYVHIKRLLYITLNMTLWQQILLDVLTITCISLTIDSITALVPIKKWNRCQLSGYKVESFWDVSVQTCGKRCDVTQDCLSFNYFPRGKFCELLTNVSWEGKHGTSKQPCLHGVRSTNNTKHIYNKRDGNCTVTACGIAAVENADVLGNMYTVGSRIKVKCHEGYRLENDTLPAECGDDGNWTNVPFCTATCGIAVVEHADVFGNMFTVGSRIKVKCHDGFRVENDTLPVECGDDGNWTNVPLCTANDGNGATSYTFGFLQNLRRSLSVYITASYPTKVVIAAPLQSYRSKITVSNGTEIKIPRSLIHFRDTGIFPDGFRLESDAQIEVYIENRRDRSTDGTVVIPDTHLSSEYILQAWMDGQVRFMVELAVVGTVDDTLVNISFPNGSGYDLYLDRSQVYYYQTTEEISGTLIKSSNNVAVFTGHECGKVITGPCDHLFEQMPPVNDLQIDFIVSYPYPRYRYILKITCLVDNTEIELSNGISLQLNRAQNWQRKNHHIAIHISANNPILVAVYSLGKQSKPHDYPDYFDGSMLIIPGLLQFKPRYTAFVPEHVTMCVLMITYPSYMSSLDNIKLNHMDVKANKSEVVNVKQRGKYTVLYTELANGFNVIYTTDGTPFGAYVSFFRDSSESWFSLPYKF